MQFLVCEIDAVPRNTTPNGGVAFANTKDAPKEYFKNKKAAIDTADSLAKSNPGKQFGVFGVIEISESKATLIKKMIDENGQIVMKS